MPFSFHLRVGTRHTKHLLSSPSHLLRSWRGKPALQKRLDWRWASHVPGSIWHLIGSIGHPSTRLLRSTIRMYRTAILLVILGAVMAGDLGTWADPSLFLVLLSYCSQITMNQILTRAGTIVRYDTIRLDTVQYDICLVYPVISLVRFISRIMCQPFALQSSTF